MNKASFIVVFIVFLGAVACCPCRKAGATTIVEVQRDSVYITHYDTMRVVERDTMWMERLEQSHDRVTIKASSSYLDNDYCISTAEVDEEGALTHTLDTRDSALLPVRTIYRDRVVRDTVIRLKDRLDAKAEIEVREVRVTTWWQRTQIVALWLLLGALAIRYRKEILSLLRRIVMWI